MAMHRYFEIAWTLIQSIARVKDARGKEPSVVLMMGSEIQEIKKALSGKTADAPR
jgi:hypothetical protein